MKDFDICTIRQGDIGKFRPFFERYTLVLRHFALKYVRDEDLVKDVVQETMVRFWERRRTFEDSASAVSFLFVTTRNALFDELRHRKVVSRHMSALLGKGYLQTDVDFHDNQAVEELCHRLEDEVSHLPARTREIIRLKLSGFQMMEIAGILGIGRETVKTLQRSGIEKLQKSLLPFHELYFAYIEA